MNIPGKLKYAESNEWINLEGKSGTVGISDYAQDQLGDIVYIELPWQSGQNITREEKFGDIESVKATPVFFRNTLRRQRLERCPSWCFCRLFHVFLCVENEPHDCKCGRQTESSANEMRSH